MSYCDEPLDSLYSRVTNLNLNVAAMNGRGWYAVEVQKRDTINSPNYYKNYLVIQHGGVHQIIPQVSNNT